MLGTELIDRLADRREVIATDLAAGYGRKGVRWSLFHLCDRYALERCRFTQRPDAVVWCPELYGVEVGPSIGGMTCHASGDRPVVKEDPMPWVGATPPGDRPGGGPGHFPLLLIDARRVPEGLAAGVDRYPARCAEHPINA